MKSCGFVLIVISLFAIQQCQASQPGVTNVLTNTCHCNCGNTSKLLIALMKSVLTQCIKKEIPSTDGHALPHGCKKVPKNCAEVLKCGGNQSGVYFVDPDGKGAFKVYCDQTTTGGGWTVFQRRKDGSKDFYRGWNDYKHGFGDLTGELWLGLEKIYRLSHQAHNGLRVELQDTTGKTAYAQYDFFAVSSERSKYKLSLGTYSGTAGDSLSYHRGMAFTTKDQDNDKNAKNCAVEYKGAWWYNSCHHSNLNGQYLHGKSPTGQGLIWYHWKGDNYSNKGTEMKIKPAV